jgi:hypothetical protein
VWVAGAGERPGGLPLAQRQYRDSYFFNVVQEVNGNKWAVGPAACAADAAWGVHCVTGIDRDAQAEKHLSYRHFSEFNTGWKVSRDFAETDYRLDKTVLDTYRRIGWQD